MNKHCPRNYRSLLAATLACVLTRRGGGWGGGSWINR